MSDDQKLWNSLGLAITAGVAFGFLFWGLSIPIFGANKIVLLTCTITFLAYFLIAGFNKNGNLERGVGEAFGQRTEWEAPTGISWWIPRPFGKVTLKHSVDYRTLMRNKSNGKPVPEVQTHDGTQVSVSFDATWRIVDVTKAATYDIEVEVESMLIRGVRWFALNWDGDEDLELNAKKALANKKSSFSDYLRGVTGILDRDNNEIENRIKQEADERGVEISTARVNDIDPPQEVIDARNSASAEQGEAVRERLNTKATRDRFFELKSGAENDERGNIDVSDSELLRTIRASKKEIEEVHVSGSGGDFTKGAALTRKPRK